MPKDDIWNLSERTIGAMTKVLVQAALWTDRGVADAMLLECMIVMAVDCVGSRAALQ